MLAFGLTLAAASCASQLEDVALPAPQPELTEVAARVFPGVSPERVVATVGGQEISAGHVAAYLEVFPALTAEQAAEDLVDIFAASARATQADVEAAAVEIENATRQAYVLEWLGRQYTRNPGFAEPDPELYEGVRSGAEYSEPFGRPAITTVSHVLVEVPEGSDDDLWAQAERDVRNVISELEQLGRPVGASDLLAYATDAEEGDEGELVRRVERHFGFPREYSGRARWSGVDLVEETFSEAAFAAEVGQLIGPVRTSYGVHAIVVEARYPAAWVPQEEREASARDIALSYPRSEAFSAELQALLAARPVRLYEENLALLGQSADERLANEASSRASVYE